MTDDKSLHYATMRYAAERICLWRLCGNMGCLRARTCKGNVRRCTSLMVDWIEAMEEEKRRVRGGFAALEDEIKTFEQLRVYLAWRALLSRAEIRDRGYPKTEEEADRLRYDLARRLANLRSEHEQKERKQALREKREEAERQVAQPSHPPSCPDLFRASNSESALDCRAFARRSK